ncbi:MAG: hypothetical protein K0B14_12340 [Anaerolineaceae bacterium]|nr:hypothetical protein [Anaerolineaceae bacterium]
MQRFKYRPKKELKITILCIVFFSISAFVLLTQFKDKVSAVSIETSQDQILRFGITLPYLTGDYVELVKQINAKAVLDWRTDDINEWVDNNIDYIHVIRVSDAAYDNGAVLDKISVWVTDNPGEVWIIGNEPDRYYYQDSVTPEVYAQRYYEIALRIRHFDSDAQIGFGSVVQPTPIRIRYLEKALNHLTYLSCGNRQAALDLIDIWSIHSFILNEHPNQWGAGVPVGFENDWSDAIQITDYSNTYSSDIFIQRLKYFRNWMKTIGEEDKPLWVTEYGSLFPEWEVLCKFYLYYDCNYPLYGWPSENETIKFLEDTFNLMLVETDISTGFSEDRNKLVQRWFWYSLDDIRYEIRVNEDGTTTTYGFGGTLFDPDDQFHQTVVGEAFESYTNQILTNLPSAESPVLFRQTATTFSVYFDQSSGTYNYPYEICYCIQLPLVFK